MDMLQTFKKHLSGLEGAEDFMLNASRQSKVQTHRFGEGIKAANELVGCLQVLSAKINKLQTIVSKIEFSLEEDSNDPANVNMSEILIAQARDLIANTKFIDKYLFDTELSVSMGEHNVSFEMPSPAPFLDRREFGALNKYIDSKKEEIKASMEAIRVLSESNPNTTSIAPGATSVANLRGKTIGEALKLGNF